MAAVFQTNGSCVAILDCCICIMWHMEPQWHCGDIIPWIIVFCKQHCCGIAHGDCCNIIARKGEPPMVNSCCIMQDCIHGTMEPIPINDEDELTIVNGCCIMHDCMHGYIRPIPIISGESCRHVVVVAATEEIARSATKANILVVLDAMVFIEYLMGNEMEVCMF
ncbi:hypothetical protein HU200_047984 [Digitaria exilis]|uniref:Uncharacterized protein n=1 Tax=Digitaria exilis TaxID=1010633 RepID=A0A835AYD6_9POAL|nr:hypothetical protein HU200_047984 [Digitaria exilis]